MSETKIGYKDVLKQRDFMKMLAASMINRFGDSIDAIAYEWMVYLLTGSATWTALIFGINKIPTIFLQPVAGAAIERMNKKRIMVITDLIRGLVVSYIAFAYFSNFLQPWMLIVTTLIISSAEAFRIPCGIVVTSRVLSKETIDYGVSLNSSLCTIVETIGLAIAAAIIAAFGVATAIGIDAVTFFLSALIILTVNTHEEMNAASTVKESHVQLLKDGAKYAVSKKLIFNFILLTVLMNAVFVPINSLQAPMVSEVLKSNAVMMSVFGVTVSVGMLLGTVVYPMIASKLSGKKLIFAVGVSLGAYHVVMPAIGRTFTSDLPKYIIVGVMSVIVGIIMSMLSTYVNATFFKIVDPEYMARTAAIMNALGSAAIPVMSFIVSLITVRVATRTIFIVTGVIVTVVHCAMAAVFDDDTSEDSIKPVEEEAEEASEIA